MVRSITPMQMAPYAYITRKQKSGHQGILSPKQLFPGFRFGYIIMKYGFLPGNGLVEELNIKK